MSFKIEDIRSSAYRKLLRENAPLREKLLNRRFYEFTKKYESRINEIRPSRAVFIDVDFIPVESFSSEKIMRTISVPYEVEEQ